MGPRGREEICGRDHPIAGVDGVLTMRAAESEQTVRKRRFGVTSLVAMSRTQLYPS